MPHTELNRFRTEFRACRDAFCETIVKLMDLWKFFKANFITVRRTYAVRGECMKQNSIHTNIHNTCEQLRVYMFISNEFVFIEELAMCKIWEKIKSLRPSI